MTYEKAKEVIKAEYYIRDYTFLPELAEALEIADEALEKRIPKKPVLEWSELFSDEGKTGHMCCSNCHCEVDGLTKYCWYCGQRIDWSDEE